MFGDYYHYHRYREALDNVTLADVYFGRDLEIQQRRDGIKAQDRAFTVELLPFYWSCTIVAFKFVITSTAEFAMSVTLCKRSVQ
jgi:hypothetical protein